MAHDYPKSTAQSENANIKIYLGVVTSVNSEKQLMTVNVSGKGEISNVPICNTVSINGVGYRYCPIPHISHVILYDQSGVLYHIGYMYNFKDTNTTEKLGLSKTTNNSSGNKNTTGSVSLQRNLEIGESSLAGVGGSEVFFPKDGSLVLFNASCSKIDMDSTLNAILTTTSSTYTELDGMIIRSGAVLRRTQGDANLLEPYFHAADGIVSLSEITSTGNTSVLSEFSIDVGVSPSVVTLAYDQDAAPTVARFSIADVVLDETGSPIMQNGSFLQVLIDSIQSSVRFCIDDEGSLIISDTTADKTTNGDITFTSGADTELNIDIGNVNLNMYKDQFSINNKQMHITGTSTGDISIETSTGNISCVTSTGKIDIYTQNSTIEIAVNGDMTFNIGVDKQHANPKYQITLTAAGTMTMKGAQGSSPVAALLGQTFMDDFFGYVVPHTHPSAMGPTGPSTEIASKFAPGTEPTYLSQSLLNN